MPQLYVFRGTTIGYKGNNAAITLPYTCTSTHPVKALWFALECMLHNPFTSVVYLASFESLSEICTMKNCLGSVEDEVAFTIKPEDFYPLCEGYIHAFDLQNIMREIGIDTFLSVRKSNLSLLCEETKPLNQEDIISIVQEMRKYLKK